MKGRTHKPMYLLLEINYCCDLRHGVGPITTYLILTLVGVTAFALCSEHFIFFFSSKKHTASLFLQLSYSTWKNQACNIRELCRPASP